MKVFNVFGPVFKRLERNKSEPKNDEEIGSFWAYIIKNLKRRGL